MRLSKDELESLEQAPFPVGENALFVCYYASAELGCFLALGWELPARILDLCAEFKCLTSGLTLDHGRGLLGALSYYCLDSMDAVEKSEMRELAIRGGPFTAWAELQLARIALVAGDLVSAGSHAAALVADDSVPRETAYLMQAEVLRRQGAIEPARVAAERALEANPASTRSLAALVALQTKGD